VKNQTQSDHLMDVLLVGEVWPRAALHFFLVADFSNFYLID